MTATSVVCGSVAHTDEVIGIPHALKGRVLHRYNEIGDLLPVTRFSRIPA